MKATLTELILGAWARAAAANLLPENPPEGWRLDLPKNPLHGDYAANIAMVGAGAAKMAPRKLAETLLANLADPDGVLAGWEIAGPGFINFRFNPTRWRLLIKEIEKAGGSYGNSERGRGVRAQVEFVSANPTGPLHVGHGRGAAVGDVTARILTAAGFSVDREYYINDAGNQIATLGGSVYLRYLELLGREVEFPDTYYKGSYIRDMAQKYLDAEGDRYAKMEKAEAVEALGVKAGAEILEDIRNDLEEFGVTFTTWYSERSLYERGEVARTLKKLEESGAAYRSEGALWMRTTAYGDEKDRVLVRADGRETYFASDISYHVEKFARGYREVIDVWGSDHHGYVPRLKAALETQGIDSKKLDILMVQFVNLLREGKPVNMSTRAGEFVTLREVREEVGRDAARFMFLSRSCDAPLDFDLEVAKRQTADNPVYYVQYANARICSVYREADATGVALADSTDADLERLEMAEELELIKFLHLFPEVVVEAALDREPHRLSFYLLDLARLFHPYYNKCRFLTEEPALTRARLRLVGAVRTVIRNGLGLMGVSSPETM